MQWASELVATREAFLTSTRGSALPSDRSMPDVETGRVLLLELVNLRRRPGASQLTTNAFLATCLDSLMVCQYPLTPTPSTVPVPALFTPLWARPSQCFGVSLLIPFTACVPTQRRHW